MTMEQNSRQRVHPGVDRRQSPRSGSRATASTGVEAVALADIRLGISPRRGGTNRAHVNILAAEGHWPPILVTRAGRTLVDGYHRYGAARMLGHSRISCVYHEGDEDSAYVEAVRLNVSHGLPLCMADRESAVGRILEIRPEWSDRRIAEAAGVAPATVGRIRLGRPGEHYAQVDSRVGRDGRTYPRDPAAVRQRVVMALNAEPNASLRVIARQVGASPETVRKVRSEQAQDCQGARVPRPPDGTRGDKGVTPPFDCVTDSAFSSGERLEFARWFDQTSIDDDWEPRLKAIPRGRIYTVADEARRRSASWAKFASALEAQMRSDTHGMRSRQT